MSDLYANTMIPIDGMGLNFAAPLPLVNTLVVDVMAVAETNLAGDMAALAHDLVPLNPAPTGSSTVAPPPATAPVAPKLVENLPTAPVLPKLPGFPI